MSGDILDLIDGALADAVSGDAMRWSPDPESAAEASYERWLNPPPDVRTAIEAREAALILAGFPRPQPVRRDPVVERPRAGYERVPFVGGPWACDLRAMRPPLHDFLNVRPPSSSLSAWAVESVVDSPPDPVLYSLRRVRVRGQLAFVYAVSRASDRDLEDALVTAYEAGWRP